MSGLAGAIAATINIGVGGFAELAHHTRRGVKANRYARGAPGKYAPFNTEADAARAVRRAKRWLANQSKGPLDPPPSHIYRNAELAVAQFGDDIAN